MTTNNWCVVKHYLNGEEPLPHLDFSMELGFGNLDKFIGIYPRTTFPYHREPAEIRIRQYKTPYLVYDGVILKRTPENELEFLKLENEIDSDYKEIWKLYVRFDESSAENIVEDIVDPVGVFFSCDYQNDLSKLIKLNVLAGWHRKEVVNSITKLLKLKEEDICGTGHWEKIEWLLEAVKRNPEILASPEMEAA